MTLNLADLSGNNGGKKISFDREIYTGTAKVSGFVKAKSSWPSKWTAYLVYINASLSCTGVNVYVVYVMSRECGFLPFKENKAQE